MTSSSQTLEAGGLRIVVTDHGDHQVATFSGRIDERVVDILPNFAQSVGGQEVAVTLVLERVHFINSVGVREWIKMMRSISRRGVELRLERCSEPIVYQMNMIVEAKGVAEVVSFYAPYQCSVCGYEGSMCIELAEHRQQLEARTAPDQSCPECAGAMELIELPQRYFLFLEELPEDPQ